VWSNQDQITTVTRSEGVTVQWTGGDPATQVGIVGFSSSGATAGGFICMQQASAGQFTVPAIVLQRLPATASGAAGTLSLNNSKIGTFTAPNLDAGYITADMVAVKTLNYR
jgi:hypothetical protein